MLCVPWMKTWQPIPVFLPGEFHGQRNLQWATVHRVSKSQKQLKQLSTQRMCYVWPLMYLDGSLKLLCLVHLNIFNDLLTKDTLDYGQWNTRVRVTRLEF